MGRRRLVRTNLSTRRRRSQRDGVPRVSASRAVDYEWCPPRILGPDGRPRPWYGKYGEITYAFVTAPNGGIVLGTPRHYIPYTDPGFCVSFRASSSTVRSGGKISIFTNFALGRVVEVVTGRTPLPFRIRSNKRIDLQIPLGLEGGYLARSINNQHFGLRIETQAGPRWLMLDAGDQDGWIKILPPRPTRGGRLKR